MFLHASHLKPQYYRDPGVPEVCLGQMLNRQVETLRISDYLRN